VIFIELYKLPALKDRPALHFMIANIKIQLNLSTRQHLDQKHNIKFRNKDGNLVKPTRPL
jgi:hypothetical protein